MSVHLQRPMPVTSSTARVTILQVDTRVPQKKGALARASFVQVRRVHLQPCLMFVAQQSLELVL